MAYTDAETGFPLDQVVVTAAQMQRLEASLFDAGMPIPALMEKVAGRIARWIIDHYPRDRTPTIGCLIGPGHNGGDALVVARELHHAGYASRRWCPFDHLKELTASHSNYLDFLEIPKVATVQELQTCDLMVDGLFGFGLTRPLEGEIAAAVNILNQGKTPIVSIDLPSGLATDTGKVLGTAIRATHTLCLGAWKLGCLQDDALPWLGQPHLIPFDIPQPALTAELGESPSHRRLTPAVALSHLPLPRSPIAHKYKVGHLLVLAGSRQYAGAALLTGLGAIASGVGMITLVLPESLRMMAVSQLSEALIIGAPETASGAMAELPATVEWAQYDVVACGPGLTRQAGALVEAVLASDRPLVLDADGLNCLAQQDPLARLQSRSAPTLLTPHPGEFRRLFPTWLEDAPTASAAAQQVAQAARCTVILKGAISAIAHPDGQLWFNPESSPALARGGSGDVLTGLVAGLAAQTLPTASAPDQGMLSAALAAVWWHAQTGKALAAAQTELGVPPSKLALALSSTLAHRQQSATP